MAVWIAVAKAASDEYSAEGIVTTPDVVLSTVIWIVLFDEATPGVVSLLTKPVMAPETYAVIAKA